MDEKYLFLAKLFDGKEEIPFCELVLDDRKRSGKFYPNYPDLCRDSPCEKSGCDDCYYAKEYMRRRFE